MLSRVVSTVKCLMPGARPIRLKLDTTRAFAARVTISPSSTSLLLERISSALLWAQNEIPDGNGFNPDGPLELFAATVNGITAQFQLERVCLRPTGDVNDILVGAIGPTDTAMYQICRTLNLRCRADDNMTLRAHFGYSESRGIEATQAVMLKRFTLSLEDMDRDCAEALLARWTY